jgi:hypothetical protein
MTHALLVIDFSKLGALSKSPTGFPKVPSPHIYFCKYSKLLCKYLLWAKQIYTIYIYNIPETDCCGNLLR